MVRFYYVALRKGACKCQDMVHHYYRVLLYEVGTRFYFYQLGLVRTYRSLIIIFHMTKGHQHHLDLCYKVLQYLWKSRHLTFRFNGTMGINFYVMVDSSYVSHSDRKSHYEFSVHMNDHYGSCISVSTFFLLC